MVLYNWLKEYLDELFISLWWTWRKLCTLPSSYHQQWLKPLVTDMPQSLTITHGISQWKRHGWKAVNLTVTVTFPLWGTYSVDPVKEWCNDSWQRGTHLLMTQLKKKKNGNVCVWWSQKGINKQNNRVDASSVDGTAKSCSWYLFASLICQNLRRVSWAWSTESAQLFSVSLQCTEPSPSSYPVGNGVQPGGKEMHRNNRDVLYLENYRNYQKLASYAHAHSCSIRHPVWNEDFQSSPMVPG